jgi:hypothetical protein
MARRQISIAVHSIALLLCATLFAWGLNGRLSGYKTPNQSHQKLVVKLIQDEHTRRLAGSTPIAPRGPMLNTAAQAALHSSPRLIVGSFHQIHEVASASAFSCSYALYRRPPPSAI